MIFLVSKKEQSSGSWYCSSSLYRWKGRPFGTQSLKWTYLTHFRIQLSSLCASKVCLKHCSDSSPGDVFVHDSVEAVVEVAAGKLKPQQRFEQVRPAQLRGKGNVAGLTVESDD